MSLGDLFFDLFFSLESLINTHFMDCQQWNKRCTGKCQCFYVAQLREAFWRSSEVFFWVGAIVAHFSSYITICHQRIEPFRAAFYGKVRAKQQHRMTHGRNPAFAWCSLFHLDVDEYADIQGTHKLYMSAWKSSSTKLFPCMRTQPHCGEAPLIPAQPLNFHLNQMFLFFLIA